MARLVESGLFEGVLKVSARDGRGVEELVERIKPYLAEGPRYFPEDMVTDQPERLLCAELIRSGVIEEAEQMIEASVDAAARTLESPLVDDLAAAGLRRLASLMAWRNA